MLWANQLFLWPFSIAMLNYQWVTSTWQCTSAGIAELYPCEFSCDTLDVTRSMCEKHVKMKLLVKTHSKDSKVPYWWNKIPGYMVDSWTVAETEPLLCHWQTFHYDANHSLEHQGGQEGSFWSTNGFWALPQYPLVICYIANWKIHPFFMGKSTMSMAIFNSYVWHNQRVITIKSH